MSVVRAVTHASRKFSNCCSPFLTASPSAAVVPDPRLFHGFNLLLHLLSVLMVWRILGLLLPRLRLTGTRTAGDGSSLPVEWAACGGALLFAIHPIQVEPVAGIDTPRVGVFVCHCGSNIGGFLDVPMEGYERRVYITKLHMEEDAGKTRRRLGKERSDEEIGDEDGGGEQEGAHGLTGYRRGRFDVCPVSEYADV